MPCPSSPPPPSPDPPDRGVALPSATPPPRRASPAAPGTPAAGPRVLLGPRSEGCPGFASPRPVPGRGFRDAARQGLAGIPELRAGSPLAAWLSRRPREEPGSPPSSPPRAQTKRSREAGGGRAAGSGQGGTTHLPAPEPTAAIPAGTAGELGWAGARARCPAETWLIAAQRGPRVSARGGRPCPSRAGSAVPAAAPALGVEAPGGGSCRDGVCLEH